MATDAVAGVTTTVATVPLAAWLGALNMGWLYVVGFILGTVYTVAGSAAQIVLTQVVPRERLVEHRERELVVQHGVGHLLERAAHGQRVRALRPHGRGVRREGARDDREQGAWTILLHQYRSNKYIQNLQSQKFFYQIVVELRVHIIDIGFNNNKLVFFSGYL